MLKLWQKGSLLHPFNLLKSLVIPCVLMVFFTIVCQNSVLAGNEQQALGELSSSSLEARKKANQYSHDTGGVGMVMSYGTKNSVSAEEIGDAFVKEIHKRGVRSRYFFYETDRDGMAISFRIRWSSLGPWDIDYAASQVSKVVARANAAAKVHGD